MTQETTSKATIAGASPETPNLHQSVNQQTGMDSQAGETSTSPLVAPSVAPEQTLIFELSSPGRVAYSLPECDVPRQDADTLIPREMLARGGSVAGSIRG